jgi:hypothetical protein
MVEVWKDLKYGGLDYTLYEVSNLGKVKNKKTRRLRSLQLSTHGYHHVWVRYEKEMRLVIVHRAVAESFIPNPDNLPVVMHLDSNKINNTTSNLQWGTYQDNALDTHRYHRAYVEGLENKIKELEKIVASIVSH